VAFLSRQDVWRTVNKFGVLNVGEIEGDFLYQTERASNFSLWRKKVW